MGKFRYSVRVRIAEICYTGGRPITPGAAHLAVVECTPGGMFYLGVFNGHGKHSYQAIKAAGSAIIRACKSPQPHSDAQSGAKAMHNLLTTLGQSIGSQQAHKPSLTGTVAVIKHNQLAVAHIGQEEAAFFADEALPLTLGSPQLETLHSPSAIRSVWRVGQADSKRVNAGGVTVYEPATELGVGDASTSLTLPGTLILGSENVWHHRSEIESIAETYLQYPNSLSRQVVRQVARLTAEEVSEKASVIAARIE